MTNTAWRSLGYRLESQVSLMSSESLDQQLSVISTLLVKSDATNTSSIASTLDILRRLESSPSHLTQAWRLLADASRDGKAHILGSQYTFFIFSFDVLSCEKWDRSRIVC